MQSIEEIRWRRSKYPLQTLSEDLTRHSPSSFSKGPVRPVASELQNDTPKGNGAASWHYATTEDHEEGRSISSRDGSDRSLLVSQPTRNMEVDAESNTVTSASQRSSSPGLAIDDTQPRSDDGETSSTSIQSLSNSQHGHHSLECPWTGASQSAQNGEDTSSEHEPPTSEKDVQEDSSQELRPAQHKAAQRTLRRIPRSQRISSPIPPTSLQPASHAHQSTSNTQDEGTAGVTPWKRQVYPLHSTASDSTTQHPPPSSLSAGPSPTETSHPNQLGGEAKMPTASDLSDPQVYPLQPSTRGSTVLIDSPQSGKHEVETPDTTSTPQRPAGDRATKTSTPPRRQRYPLQAPVSTLSLRGSPTPPRSPERQPEDSSKSSAGESTVNDRPASSNKIFRRQVYPLQSPASIGELRRPPTPPSSWDAEQDYAKERVSDDRTGFEWGSPNAKPLRRQVYPLQSPASTQDLQHVQTPASSPSSSSETKITSSGNEDESQASDQAVTQAPPFRRQGYPLQSLTNGASLQHSASPARSRSMTPKSQAKDKVDPEEVGKIEQKCSNPKPHSRHAYPLQAPASITKLQRSPSPLPDVNTDSATNNNSIVTQGRETELATKVLKQWRRQAYPLQRPKNVAAFERPTSPQPLENEKDQRHYPVHLPKNIRAVPDSGTDEPTGRTIVVCLDGTGDKFDNDNSNIVHLISALKKDDAHQVTYYQAGIGTYSANGLSAGVAAAMDMAVGAGLGLHVRDAYHFLMHTYKEGDKICIFGFSRGAYTARCLAGMIHKVGLLPPRNIQQIPFAYEFYANDTIEGWKQSNDFKNTFCIDVNVYFLGCFDSVASVGFIPRQLPLSSTPTSKPRFFRHAMALDERRAKFKICRHQTRDFDQNGDGNVSKTSSTTESAQSAMYRLLPNHKVQDDVPPGYSSHSERAKKGHFGLTDEEYSRIAGHEAPFDTDVHEVWFLGAHADVGGGAVPNDERHKLAQIPLRWMIRQSFECNTGIIFKTKILAEHGLDVHTLWPKYEKLTVPSHGPSPSYLEKYQDSLPPRSIRRSKLVPIDRHEKGEHFYQLNSRMDEDWTPEQVEDFYDAMSPMNDQLIQAPSWWILELWPVEYKVPTSPGHVITRTGMNLGRYRGVDDVEPNVHWTVLQRVQQMGYQIRVRTAAHTTWRTVV